MEVTDTTAISVTEQSQIGDARRRIVSFALEKGFSEKCRDRIAVVSLELGTNLVKHTRLGGQLLIQIVNDNGLLGLDLYCIDSGKGMDIAECMVDGFSTKRTLGTGLGAIKRMTDEFEIDSSNQNGTLIHVRFWSETRPRSEFCWGGLSVPKKDELLCGDKWSMEVKNRIAYCLLVDGLGHGIEAAEAAALAVKRFKENLKLGTVEMMRLIHTSLRGSRGAVGAVARVDLERGSLSFCGLGNIEGIIHTGADSRHLVSMNGTLGYEARKFNEYIFDWQPGATLILHSDGLSSKTLHFTDEIQHQHMSAGLMAGWLYKKHAKQIDDATIFVLKQQRHS